MSGIEMIEQRRMPRESWRRLSHAASDPTDPMRLFTFATVTDEHVPDARILVLRGSSRDLGCLWFHTDRRSTKIAQLRARPTACGVTYDPRDGVQLRIRGTVRIRADDEIAERHWEQTDMAARFAYAIRLTPGAPLPHPDPRMREHRASLSTETEHEAGRDNFVVLELAVESIEWLQIGELGDRRAVMRRAADFAPQALVP